MFYRCLPCIIYYTLLVLYVLSVSILCNSGDLIIFSSFLFYVLLIDIICFLHGLQIYIVVDIILYLYTVLIDHFFIPFLSYASPPIWKLHSHSDIIFKLCKPTFHGSYLSHNIPSSSTATIRVFHLPWQRYFYSTWSFIIKLLLSVSQH